MRNRPENQIEIRLTLIRHGATLSNKEGRYLGKTDEALSPEGIGMLKKAVTGGNYPTADLLFSGPVLPDSGHFIAFPDSGIFLPAL